MPISRRFLGAAGAAAAGGGAWAALLRDSLEAAAPAVRPSPTTTRARSRRPPAGRGGCSSSARLPVTERVLVVLEMDGGNDALNTLVPAVGRYHDARPKMDCGWPTRHAHRSGVRAASGPRWPDAILGGGTMSAIAGAACCNSRLHFTAKDAWWSGVGGSPSQTGWLGRWLDLSLDAERNGVDDPLRAIKLVAEVRHSSAHRRQPPPS